MAINKTPEAAQSGTADSVRYVLIGVLVVAAFFGAYKFASASSQRVNASQPAVAAGAAGTQVAANTGTAQGSSAQGGGSASAAGGCGMGCCGGGSGGSNAQVSGKTTVSGNLQKVTIDLTTGSYSPNKITAKAGVPLELDFKGPASSCNGQVVSKDLGFQQDVSNGGTINVGALKPGTYSFACSMNMYTAQIVVE